MIIIFVDVSASLESGAAERLRHLADAGHALVLIAPADHPSVAMGGWAERRDKVPDDAPRGSWFVTADPATCGDRKAGLRTILMGPRAVGLRPTRCDVTARDLRAAVLEILAAEAMN